MALHPDEKLRCLMVHPEFSAFSFWNYKDSCKLMDAKTPSPPLGLITVAAILPQHWEFRLLDLNARSFSEEDWAWADIVCVGGMLPQQKGILAIIERANQDGKYVAVGGSDPTSQPDLYSHASVLVVGEGESAIPIWLESWRAGKPYGIFREAEKPDVTQSPVPRFDLLRFADYQQVSVQYSRGCPFNCEFCDIIELFGRKPRTKTPEQILRELDRIKSLGYSGSIDIVDDNFIGNKRNVKRHLLPALIKWNRRNLYPFYYCTEASMNLGDDTQLLELMRDAEFRVVFMGIETPDPDILLKTQKSQNTIRPIVDRVRRIYDYGMVVAAGFIMGFDGEKRGMDHSMIRLIEECGINLAMCGLLVALPNTQLTRRLLREKRLLSFHGELIEDMSQLRVSAQAEGAVMEVVDQTAAGLNFITSRDRVEILQEFMNVIREVYEPRSYFDRALRTGLRLKCRSRHIPRWFEFKRNIISLIRFSRLMRQNSRTRWLYYRNALRLLARGPVVFEQMMRVMGLYVHFERQSAFILQVIEKSLDQHREVSRRYGLPKLTQAEAKTAPQGVDWTA